ncbi:aminopeptidase [Pilimelia terevasa]|uniref:Aminopeptidase n=1 Tax=Pilimelia terevasa TaxID=53372 RepID=A0A8J3BPJ4_9ACTN|nr:M28 family peptidase [Pilimelia terevasa]GGK29027.1 aminopeptidase [Pilimelia terevasa]
MPAPSRRPATRDTPAAPARTGAPPDAAGPPAPQIEDSRPMVHLARLQQIADDHGGNRAHGRPGYRASVEYVAGVLRGTGWTVTRQRFTHHGAVGWNVLAEWPHGDPDHVVVLGAHLDSVPEGPGINDNGSGTAAVLETALAVDRARLRPAARLRLAWWGHEEAHDALAGSMHYTRSLAGRQRAAIRAYLNFDMVGAHGTTCWDVYHSHPALGRLLDGHFATCRLATRQVRNPDDTDSWSFSRYGIPVGGIESGHDPCYHRPGDTLANVDPRVLGVATNLAVAAAWRLAHDRALLRDLEHRSAGRRRQPARP